MNPLGLIRQFIKGLTTETEPAQIAAGVALGFLIGLLPKATLTVQLLLVLVMALRVNFPIALLAICATVPFNPLFDKLTDPWATPCSRPRRWPRSGQNFITCR